MNLPPEALREQLAALQHEQWSGWMKYLFEKSAYHTIDSLNAKTNQYEQIKTGHIVIPRWAVERWQRQMNTPYAELPEEEKDSDRIEADKYLPLIDTTTREAVVGFAKEILKKIDTTNVILYTGNSEFNNSVEEQIAELLTELENTHE